jgi:hypothetical protein
VPVNSDRMTQLKYEVRTLRGAVAKAMRDGERPYDAAVLANFDNTLRTLDRAAPPTSIAKGRRT